MGKWNDKSPSFLFRSCSHTNSSAQPCAETHTHSCTRLKKCTTQTILICRLSYKSNPTSKVHTCEIQCVAYTMHVHYFVLPSILTYINMQVAGRGWDGWMVSLTRWTWVSVNSGSWWWTGRPGMLRFMGSQRVGHDWATDLIWSELILVFWTILL